MELKSSFDFKALRKAQSKIQKSFNNAGRAVEKLELPAEDVNTIQGLLSKTFDERLKKLMAEGAPVTEAAAPAEAGGGFV